MLEDFNSTPKIQRDLGMKDAEENTSEEAGKFSEQEKNIQEVFKLNPELAKIVYEAVGYDSDYCDIEIQLGRDTLIDSLGKIQNINVYYKGKLIIDSDNVKGSNFFLVTKKDGTSYIGDILMPADMQGQGLAIKILQKTADTLNTKIIPAYLATGKDNTAGNAKKMWEKAGNEVTPKHDAEKLYAEYVKTIFPESKVKDIVWHGTISNPFDTFDKDFEPNKKGVFFFGKFGQAKGYKDLDRGTLIPTVINLRNPYLQGEHEDDEKWATDQLTKESFDEIKSFGNDGVMGFGIFNDPEYIAFGSEQVHILGSEADKEEFKQFTSKQLTQKLSLRNEGQNDQIKLIYVGSGYAELVDVKGKKWRFVFGTDEWINDDVADADIAAPLGEVPVVFDRSDFKNKEEAFVYLKILNLKNNVEQGILSLQGTELLGVYEKVKQLLEQAEQETDETAKKEFLQQAVTLYESEA